MRTSNPALNPRVFQQVQSASGTAMTVQGAVNKTAMLLLVLVVAASFAWSAAALVMNTIWLWAIGGFAVAMVTVFKKEWAPITAPIYAGLEGVLIGGLSALMELSYPGIVMQAVMLTFGTLGALLIAYTSGMIVVTQKFRTGVIAATGGIFLVYLISFILSFFGVGIPLIHDGGMIGIGFSLAVVAIAALNLVLDFDFFERGAEAGLPKFMEWYAAFGLLVTLVWLYIEILRLLAKLRSND